MINANRVDSTFRCKRLLSGGYGTGGFLSVGHDLNAKNQKAPRFRTGKRAKTHQRGLWPVRRRIFPAGGRKRKRNTTRKRTGCAKISPKGCIERMSQLSICSSTTKSARLGTGETITRLSSASKSVDVNCG